MLTSSKRCTCIRWMWWMFSSSSNHRQDHIQYRVTESICILEPSLTHCSANRQESFIIFTGYNIASQYLSDGQCQLALGPWLQVSPIYSVSQPATVISAEAQSTALDLFSSYLGFSKCSRGGETVAASAVVSIQPAASLIAAPTAPILSSPTPVTSGPNQNSMQSNDTGTNSSNNISTQSVSTHSTESSDKKVKISLGVAIPVASLGLVLLGYLVYKRRKMQETSSTHEDPQPYLQQKAELEAEEKRKHELEARERRYEMGVEGERYELPVEGQDMMIQTRQELRGEEHATELDVSQSY